MSILFWKTGLTFGGFYRFHRDLRNNETLFRAYTIWNDMRSEEIRSVYTGPMRRKTKLFVFKSVRPIRYRSHCGHPNCPIWYATMIMSRLYFVFWLESHRRTLSHLTDLREGTVSCARPMRCGDRLRFSAAIDRTLSDSVAEFGSELRQ